MNKRTGIIAFLLLLISVGGSWWYTAHKTKPEDQYKFETVEQGKLLQTVSANGTLNPVSLVNIGTQVSGTVIQLKADFNDHVQKGQVLALLDPSLFDAQIAQSRANVANATASVTLALANEKRSRDLFNHAYLSRQDYDTSVQSLASAKASLALAKAQLLKDQTNKNYSVITSPVSGVIIDRQIDVGQTVAASFQTPTLFKIAKDLRKMQIDANFAEADIGKIQVGQQVTFNVDAFPEKAFKGSVKQIRMNATTTANVVTYDIVVAVENPDEMLLPGMTAYVTVIEDTRENALLIPNAALRFHPTPKDEDGKSNIPKKSSTQTHNAHTGKVYCLRNAQVTKIPLSLGISDGKYTEMTKGELKVGDQLIVSEKNPKKSKHEAGGKSKSSMKMF
jgi:HlyD family secretion protein